MSVDDAVDHFETAKAETVDWLSKEISGLRSGRVKPEAVLAVMVEHYGSRNPLQSLASVSSLDSRTLLISPWDKTAIVAIEKALTQANLGALPTVDGQVVRLSFPSLTAEVREQTIKQLHKKAEEARVRLRIVRDEALKGLKKDKEENNLSEDEFYIGKDKLDSLISAANEDIAAVSKKKETEIGTL